MSYLTFKTTTEIEAVDIPTMYKMSAAEYKEYLSSGLLFVDHHDVLRSAPAEYPLAVTREQLQMLIDHLRSLETRVGADRE